MSSSSDAGTRFSLVPASYVYLLRESATGAEVLLQQRGDVSYMAGHWAAGAAGHVERGETAYAAARREVVEELGVDQVDLRYEFCMQRTQHDAAVDERIDFFFTARSWEGTPRIVEAAKCTALEWFPIGDLPSPIVPHEALALSRLGAGHDYLTFGFDPTGSPDPADGGEEHR